MITIQSITDPSKIIRVDQVHYENVLMTQGSWVIIPDVLPTEPNLTFGEKFYKFFMEIKV